MPISIEVPDAYPLVMLSSSVLPFVANIMMGGPVMKARKQYEVKYPNLYAVPGVHKDADAFNRVQRGHQNMLETMPNICLMSLVGGLGYPITCTCSMVAWTAGSYFYLLGYSDTSLDVKTARYKKGGGVKWLGIMGVFFTSVATCYGLYMKK